MNNLVISDWDSNPSIIFADLYNLIIQEKVSFS